MADRSSPERDNPVTTNQANSSETQLCAAITDLTNAIANLRMALVRENSKLESLNDSYDTTKQQLDDVNKRISELQLNVSELKNSANKGERRKPINGSRNTTGTDEQSGPQTQPSVEISASLVQTIPLSSTKSGGSVAFSPEEKLFAWVDSRGSVVLWDIATGRQQNKVNICYKAEEAEQPHDIYSIAFDSISGKLWVSTILGNKPASWDLNTDRVVVPAFQSSTRCAGLAISPKGGMLARSGPYFIVFSLPALISHGSFKSCPANGAITLHPDNVSSANTSANDICIRHIDKKYVHRLLRGHTDTVLSLQFSPNGWWLVSGAKDGTVRVWDWAEGTERVQLHGHTSAVVCVIFLAAGKFVASGGADSTVRIWDWASGKEVRRFENYAGVNRDGDGTIAFSPANNLIAFPAYDPTAPSPAESETSVIQFWKLDIS
ncbi:quinon protein alcohol dehydrogenase-like superfamily [Xylaria acuta]|nr:quinon protein alcohol dehydrogenase-like superfamily [Xylaria acuta]